MALELNKLTKDVNALGQNLAERLAELAQQLPAAQAERDWGEMAELASLAGPEAAQASTVALLDNGLLLYIYLLSDDQALVRQLMNRYIDQLDRLQATGAAVAGVVDRPRAASVVRLLHLNSLAPQEISDESLRRLGAWERLSDGALFEFLQPGERS